MVKLRTRGRKHLSQDEFERREQAKKLAELEKKNAALERKLAQAQAIIEAQKTGEFGGDARSLREFQQHLLYIDEVQ